MAAPGRAELALTLHAAGAESSSGAGASIDIGARALARAHIDITAVSGTAPTLDVVLETSRDQVIWRAAPVGAFAQATAAGTQTRAFLDLERYVRARWTIGGTGSPSLTFSIVGSALLVYANSRHLDALALRAEAAVQLTPEKRADALEAASDEADAYLDERYELPLVTWPLSLSRHTGAMASLIVMTARGYSYEPGTRDSFKDGHDRALEYLRKVAADGDPGIVDSTPTVFEGAAAVITNARRGWGRR